MPRGEAAGGGGEGVFGGCSTPQPWGTAPEEGFVIAVRLRGPYLIPPALGLSPDMLVLQISRTLGSGVGWLGGERCSVSRLRLPAQGCPVGAKSPPLLGFGVPPWLGSPPPRCAGVGARSSPLSPAGGGCAFRCMDGAGTGAGNCVSGLTPSRLLFKQKKVEKNPIFRPRR